MPDITFMHTPDPDLLFDVDELTFEMDMISFPGLSHIPLLEAMLDEIKQCFLRTLAGNGTRDNSDVYLAAVRVRDSLLEKHNMRLEDVPNFRIFEDLMWRIELMTLKPESRMRYYNARQATRQPQQ